MKLFSPKCDDEYWLGEPIYEENRSVGFHRMWFLDVLAQKTDFSLSLQSREGYFTKRTTWSALDHEKKLHAYIIHRTLLTNEIVFDFDAPEYEQNVYNFKCIYPLLKKMGYVPYIYYSGNKGLHVHFYISYKSLVKDLDMETQELLVRNIANGRAFEKRMTVFIAKNLEWFYKKFSIDGQLNHTNHLIRSEGSLNKLGFKTFLGYTPEEVPLIPPICNPENKQYPRFPFHHYCYSDAKIKYSVPKDLVKICKEFVRVKKIGRKEIKHVSLKDFFTKPKEKFEKPCIKFLESKEFGEIGEGRKRALFILASHYKDDPDQVLRLKEWNEAILDNRLSNSEIESTARSTTGRVGCKYIKELLDSIGCNQICRRCSR
jgi:hypothetical protein